MRFCKSCGRWINDTDRSCPYCGAVPQSPYAQPQRTTVYSQPTYLYPQPYAPPPPRTSSHVKLIVGAVVIGVIVLAVIAAIAFTFAFAPLASSHATLKVKVYNMDSMSTVDYDLYIDNTWKDEGSLPPGYYMDYTFDEYPGSSCHNYNVRATSTNGTSDSVTAHLCSGETKSVDLYI